MTRQQTSSETHTPPSSGSRKRIRLAAGIFIAVSLWAGTEAWGQIEKFDEKSDRIEALENKLKETEQINASMKREMERLNDPEYKEEKAREELHLAKPGEIVFDIPRTQP